LFGIALSTVLSRIGSLIYALHKARFHEDRRKASPEPITPGLDPRPYRSLLLLSVPASITFALMAGETALVNKLLAGTAHATEAIAAYSIYYRVFLLLLSPIIAAGVAMLPYAARRFGERDEAGLRKGLSDAGRACLLYSMAVVGPILLLSASWLAGLLAESPLTARYATFGLRVVPIACIVTTAFILCRPVFEGMNQGRPGLVMAVLRYLVLAAPCAWLGMKASRVLLGLPEFYGLVVGLLAVAAVSSIGFSLWLHRALAAAFARGAKSGGATPPAAP
jgi:Na+-driven multidrug efflux pump